MLSKIPEKLMIKHFFEHFDGTRKKRKWPVVINVLSPPFVKIGATLASFHSVGTILDEIH